jgi:hypothetical protein
VPFISAYLPCHAGLDLVPEGQGAGHCGVTLLVDVYYARALVLAGTYLNEPFFLKELEVPGKGCALHGDLPCKLYDTNGPGYAKHAKYAELSGRKAAWAKRVVIYLGNHARGLSEIEAHAARKIGCTVFGSEVSFHNVYIHLNYYFCQEILLGGHVTT